MLQRGHSRRAATDSQTHPRHFALQGMDSTARINSISFHRTEDLLVSASDDDTIQLYNTQTGLESK